jgi:general secretion pathway protein M
MNIPTELRQRWAVMTQRERSLVVGAGALLGLALLWFIALRPALQTWQQVPPQARLLEAQWLEMQRLASETRELKGQTPVNAAQSAQALKAASDRLGSQARLSVIGDRATLTLMGATPEQLRTWLAEARSGARARPVELQVSRAGAGLTGQVVVSLPSTP